jgi:hypothetical protein
VRIDVRKVHRLTSAAVATGEAGFSTIHEPSIAVRKDQFLLTGNWYAARSTDHCESWNPLDPYGYMAPGPGTKFCCDQTVYYDARHDLMVWLLQYRKSTTENTLRVAIRRGASLALDDWRWWDFRPTTVDAGWTREWFDYNHVAATNDHLFIASNVLGLAGKTVFRSVVLRIPFASILSALDSGAALKFDHLVSSDASTLRCAVGCTDVMHIAGHVGNDVLRLYSWPDAAADATEIEVPVMAWNDSAYDAPDPGGSKWLTRCTDRITAGWFADGTVGWMWTSGSLGTERSFPFVRVVTVAPETGAVVSESDIWAPDFAYAYPSACPNSNGVIGVTLFRGGGVKYPGHVVGAWDRDSGQWILSTVVEGTHGPDDHKWGDYLTCQSIGETWTACGYTLQGGPTLAALVVDLVEFGVQ